MTAPTTTTERTGYFAPTTRRAALDLLADGGPTTVIGGGTLVYPRLARDVPTPRRLVDLARLPGIDRITTEGHGVTTLGAAVTYGALARSPQTPMLLRILAAGITGGPQIRNQGTVGGSACYANPSSDVPGALVALDADLVLADASRERRLAAREFFRGPFATALKKGELLVAVEVPDISGSWGYAKLKHGGSGWPVATASAFLAHTGNGSISAVSVSLGAVAAVPVTVDVPPDLAVRAADADPSARTGLRDLVEAADPDWWTDEQADATYRRRVAGAVAARALSRALNGDPA
ncbi:FAD binding domain-containing protein [Actinomycetospora chiangmaiensis]|uniref:FAD binding domain-containing protein n=1 Tax=Actinomycetospora chiangmaiensis TaxID=402650 RepID=UPI000363CA81|nr:FAD binding domain-containing protein [Actinomycetospora chiangmaiensis]